MRAHRSAFSQQVTTRQQWTAVKARQTQDRSNTNDPQKKYRLNTVGKNILLEGLNHFKKILWGNTDKEEEEVSI